MEMGLLFLGLFIFLVLPTRNHRFQSRSQAKNQHHLGQPIVGLECIRLDRGFRLGWHCGRRSQVATWLPTAGTRCTLGQSTEQLMCATSR